AGGTRGRWWPRLEALEDRTLPAVQAVSLAHPTLLSDTAGVVYSASVSDDGRYVAYVSEATNLAAGLADTNNTTDVFLYDRVVGTTTLVSHAAASPTASGNGPSDGPVLSADGRYVTFRSLATTL